VSPSIIGWLTHGLLWVCAAYFLFLMKRKTTLKEGRRW